MSKLYQCPYDKATTCNLQDPCLGCETFSEFLKAQVETPSVGNKKGEKKGCPTCEHKGKAPDQPCWGCMMPSYVKYKRAT